MNKKGLNIVLIVLLSLVWGILGYRFLFKKTPVNNNSYSFDSPTNLKDYRQYARDTFDLDFSNLSRDPFLGVMNRSPKKRKPISTKPKKTKTTKKTSWPKIEYLGFVKSEASKHPLILLRLNKKLYRKKVKTKLQGLLINKVFKDSIIISLDKEKRTIKRKR